jgi:hypothetical protein
MAHMFQGRQRTLSETGAPAGSILCGCGPHNRGLRLRVLQEQPKGQEGPIRGRFEVLEVGDNMHAPCLRPLLRRETDAEEVLSAVRQGHAGNLSVVNANDLALEPAQPQREPTTAADPDEFTREAPTPEDSSRDRGPETVANRHSGR